MTDAEKFITEAGKHANDTNWLAVVLLFICILAIAWLFRWVVGELRTLFREANDGRLECAKTIATNTTVIQECIEFMRRK
jgi:hypothetical protein